MYTVPTMHATFVVHCWVYMKTSNRINHPTYNYAPINQPTNHNFWFGMRGPPKILLLRVPMLVDWSLPVIIIFKDIKIDDFSFLISGKNLAPNSYPCNLFCIGCNIIFNFIFMYAS